MSIETTKAQVHELIERLKAERDDLKVRIHLGSEDVKHEFGKLEYKYLELHDRYKPAVEAAEDSAHDVWEAMRLVASEIAEGFRRVRKAL